MSSVLKRKSREVSDSSESPLKRDRHEKIENDPKYDILIKAVLSAPLGYIVFIENEADTPYTTLQNTLSHSCVPLNITLQGDGEYVLKIADQPFARGNFSNMQDARASLAEQTITELRKTNFFIEKKKNYLDITNKDLAEARDGGAKKFEEASPMYDACSVAHKMMQKMGWSSGKGLGVQEQGNVETVTVYENISRQGLGSANIMKEITTILENFTKSRKYLTILAFESDFTKDERNIIHKVARKLNLKSKSEGKDPNRRLTVSRKLKRMDLVKELLNQGGEDGSYKLHIPSLHSHLLLNPNKD